MVSDFINIMKTTLYFNFDLYQAFEQHGYIKNMETEKSCQSKKRLSLLVNL